MNQNKIQNILLHGLKLTEDERDALISPVKIKTKHICVIDNYTPWCGPCKMISNDFSKLANKYTSSDISETTIIFGKEMLKKNRGHPNLEGPYFSFLCRW